MATSMSGTKKVRNHPGVYVYKLANGEKRYAAVATVSGRQQWSRGHQTPEEADAAKARLRTSLASGTKKDPRLTVGAFFEKEWLPSLEGVVLPATIRAYKYQVSQIVAGLGQHRLSSLSALDIETFKRWLRRQGLGATSQHHVFTRLSQGLSRAVRWQLMVANPCDQVDPPRRGSYEPDVLNVEDVQRLLEAAAATPYGDLVYLAVATGMRESEIFALRWSDIDVASGLLRIPQSKTRAGIRAVALGPVTQERLYEHRQAQMKRYAKLDAPAPEYVFVSSEGKKMRQSKFWGIWDEIRTAAGQPTMHFHDLRHVHATLCARVGAHPSVTQARVGHSRARTTLEIYTHVQADDQAPAAAAVEELLVRK